MGVHNVQNMEEWKQALSDPSPFVIDAFATWCGPCKMIAPVVERFEKQFDGKVRVYKFDVDQVKDLATELGITAMPTIIGFKAGEKVDSVRGANPAAIEKLFKDLAEA